MNDSIQTLLAQLKSVGAGGKSVAVLVGLAVVAVVASVAVVTSGPAFEMAFSNLSDHESAAVMKALSEVGIEFRVSQPPGPFVVYVDEDNVSKALGAAYGSGALDQPLRGVRTEATGMSSVFLGAKEREQRVRFRELEELEGVLEDLAFVASARVLTSREGTGTLGGRGTSERSASVVLRTYNGGTPTAGQATSIAQLVSRALGISQENISVSDQAGEVIFDGDSRKKSADEPEDWLVFKQRYDVAMGEKANDVLTQILGPSKARVMVDSRWDFDRKVIESRAPIKGDKITEDSKETSTPIDENPNVVTGLGSIPATDPNAADGDRLVATTTDKRTEYTAGVTNTSTVSSAPALTRLSVALFLDESIPAEQRAALEGTVKTTVGWFPSQNEQNDTSFSTTVLPFYAPEDVAADETQEEPARPNPLINTLLRRGVEIGTALVFLFLLLRTLRGAKKAGQAVGTTGPGAGAPGMINVEDLDPELLAREQVQDLLSSDPERVGKILSSWAREEQQLTGERQVSEESVPGIQRVAAFLLSLDEDKVAAVLKHLADDVVEQVARAMMELDAGMDSSAAIESLYRELAVRANLPRAVRPCTSGELEEFLARSHGADRARSLVADIQSRLHRDRPFSALEAYPEGNIAKVLAGEPPAIVAMVASQITPSVTASILKYFDEEKATETLRRMASVKAPPATVLLTLAEDLEARLVAMVDQPVEIADEDRLRGIAEILSYSSPELESGVVESLQAVNEESASALREFLFTWEDISTVDKRSMQKILGTVDTKTLSLALKGCGKEVEENVMSNLSERVRDMVAEERELAGAVPRNEVAMARDDILKSIRSMIESGEFRPARSGEDLVA